MATYKDPVRCFAPLEMIERLLEIRTEAGCSPFVYIRTPNDVVAYLDAYGFDVFAFNNSDASVDFGKYSSQIAPGGDRLHSSMTAH